MFDLGTLANHSRQTHWQIIMSAITVHLTGSFDESVERERERERARVI